VLGGATVGVAEPGFSLGAAGVVDIAQIPNGTTDIWDGPAIALAPTRTLAFAEENIPMKMVLISDMDASSPVVSIFTYLMPFGFPLAELEETHVPVVLSLKVIALSDQLAGW
jgi:hypothetical protein